MLQGLTTLFSGWMTSFASLIVVRLFLGLFEGGLLPGRSFLPRGAIQSFQDHHP